MGKIIDYCCGIFSLVSPMFMKCIEGSGLVKLVKISRPSSSPVVGTYMVKMNMDR